MTLIGPGDGLSWRREKRNMMCLQGTVVSGQEHWMVPTGRKLMVYRLPVQPSREMEGISSNRVKD